MVVATIKSSFRVQYLAQGHFGTQSRGTEPATFNKQDAGSATPVSTAALLKLTLLTLAS